MIKFPFTTLQQFNLDWIMQQLHKILDFMPLNGSAGDVLQRTVDGAAWQPITAVSLDVHALNPITPPVEAADELPIYDNDLQGNYKATVQQIMAEAPVQSVNGYTGYVDLNATDVNALPDTTVIPTDTADLTNTAGFVDAAGAAAAAPVQSVNGQTGNVVIGGSGVTSVNGQTGAVVLGKSDVGLGNVDNVQQYSASNPPPYPVTSVNGQTGDVVVSASSLVFGSDASITLTAPAGITLVASDLYAQTTTDGKALRIHGVIRTMGAPTAGWRDFTVSGITITPPSSAVTLNNVGLWLDENETVGRDDPAYIRISVDTSGNIKIGLYYRYALQESNAYNFIVFPFIVTLP